MATGLKITNPLSRAVRVRINSATGALHIGDGKETWRTIKPGETLYIPTKGKCELDITVHIVRYNEVGDPVQLGYGALVPVPRREKIKAGPVLISGQRDLKSGRWVIVAQWVITKERSGVIRAVSIQLDRDCEAQVIIGLPDPPVKVKADTRLRDWQTVELHQKEVWLNEGESVKVKAHAVGGGKGICQVIIRGELYHIGKAPKPAPERVPEPDTEETPLRSLGDMLDAMKKSEEGVKV